MIYVTTQGDTFDGIAKKTLGDEHFLTDIMRENPQQIDVAVFSAGVKLTIPDVESAETYAAPPWREGTG